MTVSNATTTETKLSSKRDLESINGDSSDPRSIKKRRTPDNQTTNSTKRECINGDNSKPCGLTEKKRTTVNRITTLNDPRRPRIGLLSTLLSLGVDHPTWILHKTLQTTDLHLYESRLLLTSKKVMPSPLLGLLTDAERESVREKSGLKVRAFDWLGREYRMVFKFLQSNNAYRLIGEWSRFLRENDGAMRAGDAIEIWGFRIQREEGRTEIGMALLHYDKEEQVEKEEKQKSVIKGKASNTKSNKLKEEVVEIEEKHKSVIKGKVSKSMKNKKIKVTRNNEWNADEYNTVVALLQLKGI